METGVEAPMSARVKPARNGDGGKRIFPYPASRLKTRKCVTGHTTFTDFLLWLVGPGVAARLTTTTPLLY
jgi:hypothetical protein